MGATVADRVRAAIKGQDSAIGVEGAVRITSASDAAISARTISACGEDTDAAVAAISAREKGQATAIGVEGAMCSTSANVAAISAREKGQDVAMCMAVQTAACEQGERQLAADSVVAAQAAACEEGQGAAFGVEGAMCITSAAAEISACGKGQGMDAGANGSKGPPV